MKIKDILFIFMVAVLSVALNIFAILTGSGVSGALAFLGLPPTIRFPIGNLSGILMVVILCLPINRYFFQGRLTKLLQSPSILRLLGWFIFGLAITLTVFLIFLWTGLGEFVRYSQATIVFGITAALLEAFGAGFVEELAYRYLFYGYLRTIMKRGLAIFIAGFFFGILHLNQVSGVTEGILLLVGALGVSLLFITIYEKTGSIWPGAIVHTLWNAFTSNTGFWVFNRFQEAEQGYYLFAGMKVSSPYIVLNGGSFGVDISLVSFAVYVVFAVVLILMPGEKIFFNKIYRPSQVRS